jgi:hypothetical protein
MKGLENGSEFLKKEQEDKIPFQILYFLWLSK